MIGTKVFYAAGDHYEYWISGIDLSFASSNYSITNMTKSGDLLYCSVSGSNPYQGVVAIGKGGEVKFAKSSSVTFANTYGIDIDSDGDLQFSGRILQSSDYRGVVYSYDTDMSHQSSNTAYGATTSDDIEFYCVACASGATYVGGDIVDTTVKPYMAEYNNSTTVQWARYISSHVGEIRSVDVDSSNEPYFFGHADYSPTGGIVLHYNGSGTIQWQRQLGHATHALDTNWPVVGCVDSSDNPIIALAVGTTDRAVIGKYNSSGTIQWQREILTTATCGVVGIDTDSSDNVYAAITIDGLSDQVVLLVKWNSSGTIQWQRTFSQASNDIEALVMSISATKGSVLYIDSNDDIHIAFNRKSDGFVYVAKLPNDGTGTGTYHTSIVYGSSSYTEQAGTLTDAVGGLTSGTPTDTTTNLGGGWATLTDELDGLTTEEIS